MDTFRRRRCQIEVQFESGARTKFLVALFQPMTSISDHKSVPWFHSFQNMYNTHMCKMNTEVEKLGFSKKIYLVLMKKCKKKNSYLHFNPLFLHFYEYQP